VPPPFAAHSRPRRASGSSGSTTSPRSASRTTTGRIPPLLRGAPAARSRYPRTTCLRPVALPPRRFRNAYAPETASTARRLARPAKSHEVASEPPGRGASGAGEASGAGAGTGSFVIGKITSDRRVPFASLTHPARPSSTSRTPPSGTTTVASYSPVAWAPTGAMPSVEAPPEALRSRTNTPLAPKGCRRPFSSTEKTRQATVSSVPAGASSGMLVASVASTFSLAPAGAAAARADHARTPTTSAERRKLIAVGE
jgi:hypothetical protein